jgi:hypothetical protein
MFSKLRKGIGSNSMVDEKAVNAIEIAAPAIGGWIFGIVVYDETTGEDFLYSEKSGRNELPVAIPYDHSISISASAQNTGDTPQWMQLTAELIDPDGIVRKTAAEHYANVSPGSVFTSGKTGAINPDKFGTWKVHAVLEADVA